MSGALGKCDVPPRTLETLFDQVKGEKFDLVLFTGDISPHDVYNQTIESQKYLYNLTYSMFMRWDMISVLRFFGNETKYWMCAIFQPVNLLQVVRNWLIWTLHCNIRQHIFKFRQKLCFFNVMGCWMYNKAIK